MEGIWVPDAQEHQPLGRETRERGDALMEQRSPGVTQTRPALYIPTDRGRDKQLRVEQGCWAWKSLLRNLAFRGLQWEP